MSNFKNFSTLRSALADSETTVLAVVNDYLTAIEAKQHLNAFLEVFTESSLQSAVIVDEKIKAGTAGKLAGMVIGLKDNICYKGHHVSSSSKILEGFESIYSATVVERLLAEDAIIIGRLNCDEFAMGSSNENSAFGPVLNPIDETRVPGGSSGGSAAAVAAGLCMATLGSDTGGSIRQPASFCGLVGYKPTYGTVSRHGLLAYASSCDQIGPLTTDVADTALLLEVMSGADAYDGTISSAPTKPYSEKLEFTGKKKIAYIKECLESKGLHPDVKAKMEATIEKLRAEGHEVEAVDFPYLDYMVPTYYVITTAEASSNLARYDGIHYGYRSEKAVDIDSTYVNSRSEGFGDEVKRRIMLGTFVLSAGYYDAYFTKAHKVRKIIQQKTKEIFASHDFIILPTTPAPAFKFGENSEDPITMYLQDIFTVQANLAGGPAISIPLGETKEGLPFGIQAMGDSFKDAELLAFSSYLEENY